MADYAISNVARRVVYTNTGVGPYAFTFEILANTDIAVYRGSTLLTLTTDYSVTINANGTGSITLVTAGTGNIAIVGARAIQRTSDYTTGGDLFASTLNTDLDSQTIYAQQVAETAERSIKAPAIDPTDINMTLPSRDSRANKYLAFDNNGNPIASAGSSATSNDVQSAIENGISLFKNRLINGNFLIDQKQAGASKLLTGTFGSTTDFIGDRWVTSNQVGYSTQLTMQVVSDAPTGFNKSLKLTVTTSGSYNFLWTAQTIEGNNIYDFSFGTTSAKNLMLSFWVKSSRTGTFGGNINNAGASPTRSYVFSYTINTANTWEFKTVSIPGETSGTWRSDHLAGMNVYFSHGATTTATAGAWYPTTYNGAAGQTNIVSYSGATWQITGIQLEVGSYNTTFNYRPITVEQSLCNRYYYKIYPQDYPKILLANGYVKQTTTASFTVDFPDKMRVAPSLEVNSTTDNYSVVYFNNTPLSITAVPTLNSYTTNSTGVIDATTSTTMTGGGNNLSLITNLATSFIAFNAEY